MTATSTTPMPPRASERKPLESNSSSPARPTATVSPE